MQPGIGTAGHRLNNHQDHTVFYSCVFILGLGLQEKRHSRSSFVSNGVQCYLFYNPKPTHEQEKTKVRVYDFARLSVQSLKLKNEKF